VEVTLVILVIETLIQDRADGSLRAKGARTVIENAAFEKRKNIGPMSDWKIAVQMTGRRSMPAEFT
jgi:hypothetical protein